MWSIDLSPLPWEAPLTPQATMALGQKRSTQVFRGTFGEKAAETRESVAQDKGGRESDARGWEGRRGSIRYSITLGALGMRVKRY